MDHLELRLLLAEDDIDDCEFFKGALVDVPQQLSLTIVKNGVELMDFLLEDNNHYPDVIFLDLNMPKKSGLECISEIKASDKLKHIPIVIFSTSLDKPVVKYLYEIGASHYVQKPSEFRDLKKVIQKTVMSLSEKTQTPSIDQFIIKP